MKESKSKLLGAVYCVFARFYLNLKYRKRKVAKLIKTLRLCDFARLKKITYVPQFADAT